jgi:hypothetical protein
VYRAAIDLGIRGRGTPGRRDRRVEAKELVDGPLQLDPVEVPELGP